MPCQLLDTLLVVLLNELLASLLVVVEHDALQESVRECQGADLVFEMLAQVNEELVVAVVHELCRKALCNLLAERLLVLHLVLAVYAVEELLVDFCLHEA